jgi:hypothetical protein
LESAMKVTAKRTALRHRRRGGARSSGARTSRDDRSNIERRLNNTHTVMMASRATARREEKIFSLFLSNAVLTGLLNLLYRFFSQTASCRVRLCSCYFFWIGACGVIFEVLIHTGRLGMGLGCLFISQRTLWHQRHLWVYGSVGVAYL